MPSKKIMLGMGEVANYYGNLAQGLSDIGLEPECVFFSTHRYHFEERFQTRSLAWMLTRRAHRNRTSGGFLKRIVWLPVELCLRLVFVAIAARRFHYFVFAQGNSLLPLNVDLLFFRLARKKILVVSHGSDFRPDSISGYRVGATANLREKALDLSRSEPKRARRLRRVEKLANNLVGHELSTSQFLESRQVSFLAIGIPIVIENLVPALDSNPMDTLCDNGIRLVHATSDLFAKGTRDIEKLLEELREEGLCFRYVRLYQVPHQEVLAEIQKSDIVLDELYSDTTMASVAVEGTWLGKPVVVGVNGLDVLEQLFDPSRIPPTCYCHPEDYKETVRKLIESSSLRKVSAARAKQFVEENWKPNIVAERLMAVLEGKAPDEWYFEPSEIATISGLGHPASRSAALVAEIYDTYSYRALGFAEHPKLLRLVQTAARELDWGREV